MTDILTPDPQHVAWNTAYAESIISAPQQRIWEVLTDFPNYDTWNSFTYGVVMSDFAAGVEFEFTVNMARWFQRQQRERITHIEPPRLVAWGFPLGPNPWLNATRFQVLTPLDDGTVYYQTWETFTGLFAPFIRLTVFGMVQRGFEACARDLKAHCESST